MKALTKALAIAAVLCLGFGVACDKKEEAKADAPAEASAEVKKDEAAAPAEAKKDEAAAPAEAKKDGDAPKAAPSSQ